MNQFISQELYHFLYNSDKTVHNTPTIEELPRQINKKPTETIIINNLKKIKKKKCMII